MDNHYYNKQFYSFPHNYFNENFEKVIQKVKDIKDVKKYENDIFNNKNIVTFYPNFILKIEENKYYNIRKNITYDCEPIKKKYSINGGIICESYEFEKKELLEELITNHCNIDNNGFRYKYEDGILFKYQLRTNCTLIIIPKKYMKLWYTIKKYSDLNYTELLSEKCVYITYEEFSKLIINSDYTYINYFNSIYNEENEVDNIFHIYWKRIIFMNFDDILSIRKCNLSKLKSCVSWFIVKKNKLNYNMINGIINYTISDENYNKCEYFKYFIENNIFKINECDNLLNNKVIHKIDLSNEELEIYNLNVKLKEHKYNLLSYLNKNDVNLKNKNINFDNFENSIIKMKKKILLSINAVDNSICKFQNKLNKTFQIEQMLLNNENISENELLEIKMRIQYIKNDIKRHLDHKSVYIKHLDYIANNLIIEENYQCPICFNNIEDNYGLTSCGHIYCLECCSQLTKSYVFNCPTCRYQNFGFNYISNNNITNNIKKKTKINVIMEYIYNIISENKVMILCDYKDTLKLFEKEFNKKYKCSFMDRKIKLKTKIYLGLYDKVNYYNLKDIKKDINEIILIHPSINNDVNNIIDYKFNNIKKSYFICNKTLEENIIKY